MNMLLACDMVLAADSAKFDSRFLQIGLHPGGGHTWRLRHITNQATTMAMVLFGQRLTGQQAAERGLAWECVADDELQGRAQEIAARAASFPKELVAKTKATITNLDQVVESNAAVDFELEPQLWSMAEPQFQALVTSLQKNISSKD